MHPFSAALQEIATIPGTRYSCVADADTGDVLAEKGPPGPDPSAALRWGRHLAGVLRSAGELEDVTITAERTYHLLRRVRAGPRRLLVHVSLDRSLGNLASARRTLGALDLDRPLTAPSASHAPTGQRPAAAHPAAIPPAPTAPPTSPGPSAPVLPVRPPRPIMPTRRPTDGTTDRPAGPERGPAGPERSAAATERAASPPSAVAPPRVRVPVQRAAEPAVTPAPVIPEARGWSDDLHTMHRLLDALRRMA